MRQRGGRKLVVGGILIVLKAGAACQDDGGVARDGSSLVEAGADSTGEQPPLGDATPESAVDAGGGVEAGSDGSLDPDARMVSGLSREIIAAPTAEVATLTADNRAFALRLYRALRAEPPAGNLFFSPHSISVALAMTHAGARGTTATQMASTLEFKLPPADLHRAFNALDQELARRSQPGPADNGGEPPRLAVSNALWGRQGYRFVPEYLDLLAVNYGAGLRTLDFAGNTEGARLTINAWVEEQTAGRIRDLLTPADLRPDTILVLTNAVYFKGSWQQPFQENATTPAPFHPQPGMPISVPTMRMQGELAHVATGEYEAVQLPYVGGKLAMLLIAPVPGREAAFEAGLSVAALEALTAGLAAKQVRLLLPKFRFTARFKLKPTLSGLGMPLAFSEQADFSGMSATGQLTIFDVIHQAFVGVDEKGTEAAAATAVVAGPPSGPPTPVEVKLDRPFLFLIRDVPTGALLFLGRLADPR